MASPTVRATNTSATITAGTSHVVSLPANLTNNELLIVCCGIGSTAATFNALAGWTELQDENTSAGIYIAYKWSDGTEGASITLTTSASTRDASVSFAVDGAQNPAVQAPQIGIAATSTSVNPNPPAITPTGGSKDYLFIAVCSSAGEQADDGTYCTAFPTNYTGTQLMKACGTVGTNLGGMIAVASRQATLSTDDPGTFTVSENDVWRTQTIAVHPASPPNPPPEIMLSVPVWGTRRA